MADADGNLRMTATTAAFKDTQVFSFVGNLGFEETPPLGRGRRFL